MSRYQFFIVVALYSTLSLTTMPLKTTNNESQVYALTANYSLKNDKYDKKDIPVYHLCKPDKTIETSDVITIWVHGYADTYEQVFKYIKSFKTKKDKIKINDNSIISSDCVVTFDFADAGKAELVFKHKKTSMAQDSEIHRLNKIIQHVKELNPTADIVLAGMSRGASTIITTMARHVHPEVKALILESPFGSIEDIVNNMKPSFISLDRAMSFACTVFGSYKRDGIRPIDVVDQLPKDLAIIFIASKKDQRVPVESTLSLYDELINSGHQHTYLQLLDHGKHSKLLSSQDGSKYQQAIHTFNTQVLQ